MYIYIHREIYRIHKERWKQWNSWQNRHPSRTHIGGSCQLRRRISRPVHQGSTVTNLHITLGPYCEKVQLFGCFLPTFHGKTSWNLASVHWKEQNNLAPLISLHDTPVTWCGSINSIWAALHHGRNRHHRRRFCGGVLTACAVIIGTSASFEKMPSLHLLHLSLHIFHLPPLLPVFFIPSHLAPALQGGLLSPCPSRPFPRSPPFERHRPTQETNLRPSQDEWDEIKSWHQLVGRILFNGTMIHDECFSDPWDSSSAHSEVLTIFQVLLDIGSGAMWAFHLHLSIETHMSTMCIVCHAFVCEYIYIYILTPIPSPH